MRTKRLYQLGSESFEMKRVYELDKNKKPIASFDYVASDRVGNCWMAGRLKPGDIVLCDELDGDCFYNWYLVEYTNFTNEDGVRMRLVPYPFGAYAMKATELQGFTERDYHLLKAGEQVIVKVELPRK